MDKIRVIKRSLRCYHLAWFGLVPVLGLWPAVAVIVLYHMVRLETGEAWNPAEAPLRRGYLIAWLSLGLTALALGVVWVIISPWPF